MAICSKCMTGFDSNLERCPQCGYVYRPGVNRRNLSWIATLLYFLFIGVGVLVSAVIFCFAIANLVSKLVSMNVLPTTTWGWLLWGLHFSIIFWSYQDANKRRKPGCLVAFLVAAMPIMGLVTWLIFRP